MKSITLTLPVPRARIACPSKIRYPVARRPRKERGSSMLDRNSEMVSEQRMNDRTRLAGHPIARMNGAGNAILVLDLRGSLSRRRLGGRTRHRQRSRPALRPVDGDPRRDDRPAPMRTCAHLQHRWLASRVPVATAARCVAWFLLRESEEDQAVLLTTRAGEVECRKVGDLGFLGRHGQAGAGLGCDPVARRRARPRSISANIALRHGSTLSRSAWATRTPIFFVRDTASLDLETIGPPLEHAPVFPERANISFAQIVDSRDDQAACLGARRRLDAGLRDRRLRDARRGGLDRPHRARRLGRRCRAAGSISSGVLTTMSS